MKYVLRRHSSSTGLDGQRFRPRSLISPPIILPSWLNNFVFIARGRRSARKGSLPAMTPSGFIIGGADRNHSSSTTLMRCTKRSRGCRLIRLADIALPDRLLPEEIMQPRGNVPLFLSFSFLFIFLLCYVSVVRMEADEARKFLVSRTRWKFFFINNRFEIITIAMMYKYIN